MPDTLTLAGPVELAYEVGTIRPRLFLHDRQETISNGIRRLGIWQFPITAFIVAYLRRGDVFVDVGANIGYFSVFAALAVGPDGKVHAVEPEPANLALLQKNLELNGLSNVEVHAVAASDRSGQATLYRDGFNSGGHSLLQKPQVQNTTSVSVTTLDALLDTKGSPRLIKIDVQGSEVDVLKGMSELLRRDGSKPGLIVEFAPTALAKRNQLAELFELLAVADYQIYPFIANERSTLMPPQVRRATLQEIANDFIAGNNDAEFDLLLLPRDA